jgi:hypothetical protein
MRPRLSLGERANPVLLLPAAAELREIDPAARRVLCALLLDLRREARLRAERSWKMRKPPMAAYWAAVAVYAGHIARILR